MVSKIGEIIEASAELKSPRGGLNLEFKKNFCVKLSLTIAALRVTFFHACPPPPATLCVAFAGRFRRRAIENCTTSPSYSDPVSVQSRYNLTLLVREESAEMPARNVKRSPSMEDLPV